MAGLNNNPHYKNGVYLGAQVAKHIETTTYGTLEVAIERKKELVKDLKKQFGWDENTPDVAETLGIIAALEEEQSKQPEEKSNEVSLSIEDVCGVADSIGVKLESQEIIEILDDYQNAQEEDPGATWNLVIEQLIHEKKNG